MLLTTLDAMKAMLRADPSISPGDRVRLMTRLREGPELDNDKAPAVPQAPHLLRRSAVAARLSTSLRTVDNLCRQGLLKKRVLDNRQRAYGILAESVDALITGNWGAQ